jgi:hypothetical protein
MQTGKSFLVGALTGTIAVVALFFVVYGGQGTVRKVDEGRSQSSGPNESATQSQPTELGIRLAATAGVSGKTLCKKPHLGKDRRFCILPGQQPIIVGAASEWQIFKDAGAPLPGPQPTEAKAPLSLVSLTCFAGADPRLTVRHQSDSEQEASIPFQVFDKDGVGVGGSYFYFSGGIPSGTTARARGWRMMPDEIGATLRIKGQDTCVAQ